MPRHLVCGLSLFLAASANAYAQQAVLPLPDKGFLDDNGVQTLLYIIPNDVEVKVERHWLQDSNWQLATTLRQPLLNADENLMTVQLARKLSGGRMHVTVQHDDRGLFGEVGMTHGCFGDKLKLSGLLQQDENVRVLLQSRLQVNDYTQVGVRISDSNGSCANGCADLQVTIPL